MADKDELSKELEQLQREVAELRSERKAILLAEESQPSEVEDDENESGALWDDTVKDLAAQLETTARELENATRERPALGLLAAFASGIVVGHLLLGRK